jgi:hypothetical protein
MAAAPRSKKSEDENPKEPAESPLERIRAKQAQRQAAHQEIASRGRGASANPAAPRHYNRHR